MNANARSSDDLLYIEPFAGMAGDMFLAALLDLRDPRFELHDLERLTQALVPGEARFATETVWRGSLSGRLLDVHTADSATLPHRRFADLAAMIERAPLTPAGRARARAVLWRIAVAEGRVHGCAPEEIHFHEIGAVDTLIDVCGAVLALERLEVHRVRASPPLVGSGTVQCAHGEMPVPVPAVAELLRGIPHTIGGGGERLTPTGAALLLELCEAFEAPGEFVCRSIGYGAGHRDPQVGPPNVLRVQLGCAAPGSGASAVAWQLECNLDDVTGEEVGFVVQELRAAGALEVWTAAVQMKKDRPGVVVSALAREERRQGLERVLFELTPTLGVRWTRTERTECSREPFAVEVLGSTLRGALRRRPGAAPTADPTPQDVAFEYDDLARLARSTGRSLREIETVAREVWLAQRGASPSAQTPR